MDAATRASARNLRVASGDRIEFVEVGPGRFEILAANGSVRDLKGILGARARTVSQEEMDPAIVAAAIDSE